jgi:hypothetical protein
MRIVSKLVLLAMAITAFMAMNAVSASAVTVSEENGDPCTTVTENIGEPNEIEGGCPVAGISDGHFELGGLGGFIMINCDITLAGAAGGDGHLIGSYTIVECEQNLAHACTDEGERHAEAQPTGPIGGTGILPIEASFCADVEAPINLGPIHCDVIGTLNQVGHAQSLNFSHSNQCHGEGQGAFTIQGRINVTNAHPPVEVSN